MDNRAKYYANLRTGISAVIYTIYETIKKVWDLAEKAAEFNKQMQLLEGLAEKRGRSWTTGPNTTRT